MDPRLLKNKRFLNLFIRPVKVDYGLLLQYQAAEVPEKVTCDLTAFYASEDLTAEEVCQWQGLYSFFSPCVKRWDKNYTCVIFQKKVL